jgi:glutamyl/glutaminyl-tRNA synthetase
MIIDLAKERSDFNRDLNKIVDLFYNDPIITNFIFDDNYKKVMSSFIDNIDSVRFNNTGSIKLTIAAICDGFGIKIGKVMPGLRMALVGGFSGPDLMTTMSILDKTQTIKRITASLIKE